MKVTAFKTFLHGELGMFEKGKQMKVPDDEGLRLVSMGYVEESGKGEEAPKAKDQEAEPAKKASAPAPAKKAAKKKAK